MKQVIILTAATLCLSLSAFSGTTTTKTTTKGPMDSDVMGRDVPRQEERWIEKTEVKKDRVNEREPSSTNRRTKTTIKKTERLRHTDTRPVDAEYED